MSFLIFGAAVVIIAAVFKKVGVTEIDSNTFFICIAILASAESINLMRK